MSRDRAPEIAAGGIPSLVAGTLVFRWVWLVWMITLAFTGRSGIVRPALAAASLLIAGAWTVWLTVARPVWDARIRMADLLVCAWLIGVSGLVVAEGAVVAGAPFFATGYGLSAAFSWGATSGPAMESLPG